MNILRPVENLYLNISSEVLDWDNVSYDGITCCIPIIKNNDNAKDYDSVSCYMSLDSCIIVDLNKPKLYLCVMDYYDSFKYSIMASFQESAEVDGSCSDFEDIILDIDLSENELQDVGYTILQYFNNNESYESLTDLRADIARLVYNQIGLQYVGLFKIVGDCIDNIAYHAIWLGIDNDRWMIVECKNINIDIKNVEIFKFGF